MIITVANQKGGVSKTTTCAALACALHNAGKRVLAVDMDPQCSLSFILGADTNAPGVLDLLQGGSLPELVQHTEQCDIQHICFLRVYERAMIGINLLRNKILFDSIGMDVIVDFCQFTFN